MKKDNVVEIKKPESFIDDPLTGILRQRARSLLAQALEVEIETVLNQYKDLKDQRGYQRVVRNGYMPERNIQTGIGFVPVEAPRIRDRSPHLSERIAFSSSILPPYLRKTRSMEQLIPWLYLKGISTGDFSDALVALVGNDAPGLSAPTISRLKTVWQQEFGQWQKRSLEGKCYVYFWVDGIYCNVRMDEKQCLLVIVGATADGTRWQRCWVHKTANVLNSLPKSLQSKAKSKLYEIWQAASKDEAERHFNDFVNTYEAKYPKAVQCLEKDRDALLAFYDFPAEHWRHIRTTNPIESTFATVRLRTNKVRGCFSANTILTMVFKLCQCAQKRWIRLHRPERLADVVNGVKFVNGMEEKRIAA